MTFSVFNDDMPSDSGTNKSKSVSRSEKVSLGLQEKVACNNCNDSSSKTKLDKQEIMAVKNTLKSSKISKISTENASDLKVQLTSKTKTVTNKTSEKTSVKESKLASKGLKVLSKDSKEGLKVISKDELKVESKVVSSPPKRNRPDHAFLAFHDNKENWDSEHKEFTTNRQSKKNRIALSIKSDRVPLADITASYRTKLQPRVTSAESTTPYTNNVDQQKRSTFKLNKKAEQKDLSQETTASQASEKTTSSSSGEKKPKAILMMR